jgi:hypothetical protein
MPPMRRALGLLTASMLALHCHLIGGAGDLTFTDGFGAGGSGGAGGAECAEACGPCHACASGSCEPTPGAACESDGADGICDVAGACATGTTDWSRLFGNTADAGARDVAVGDDGDVVVVGFYEGDPAFTINTAAFDNAGTANGGDLFVMKLSPDSRQTRWANDWGSTADLQVLDAVAVGDNGKIAVAGRFVGEIEGDGFPSLDPPKSVDSLFVGLLDDSGVALWGMTATDSGLVAHGAVAVAVAPSGRVAAIANTEDTIRVPDGATGTDAEVSDTTPTSFGVVMLLEETPATAGEGQASWVFPLDSGDNHLWATAFDAMGQLWVVGEYRLPPMLPVGSFPGSATGPADAIVLRLDAASGEVTNAWPYAGEQDATATAVAATPTGVVVAGTFHEGLSIGAIDLVGDSRAIWIASFDFDGNALWAKAFPYAFVGAVRVNDIAVDGAGNIALVGRHSHDIDFGGPRVEALSNPQAFVAKLDADGNALWARSSGATGDEVGSGVAFDAAGGVVIAGAAASKVFDTMDDYVSGSSIFVTRLNP